MIVIEQIFPGHAALSWFLRDLNDLGQQLSGTALEVTQDSLLDFIAGSRYVIVAMDTRPRDDHPRVIGIGILALQPALFSRRGRVEDVVVHSDFRGQGISHKIMEALEAAARDRGYTHIELSSRSSRVAANRLYESRGYVIRDTNVFRLELGEAR